MEDVLQALSEMLAAYARQELYEVDPDATHLQAGRELREWIKRRLVVKREGRIYATDALEPAIQFVDSLDNGGHTPSVANYATLGVAIDRTHHLSDESGSKPELFMR